MEREITMMVVVLKEENVERICKKGEKCGDEREGKVGKIKGV